MYCGMANNETFINMWLNMLFNDAQQIFERQVAYYDSLNFFEYILNKISFDKNNEYNIFVKVIGFNSKKFDINIFVNYITDSFVYIKLQKYYINSSLLHNDY
jgi:hypothetical protein